MAQERTEHSAHADACFLDSTVLHDIPCLAQDRGQLLWGRGLLGGLSLMGISVSSYLQPLCNQRYPHLHGNPCFTTTLYNNTSLSTML